MPPEKQWQIVITLIACVGVAAAIATRVSSRFTVPEHVSNQDTTASKKPHDERNHPNPREEAALVGRIEELETRNALLESRVAELEKEKDLLEETLSRTTKEAEKKKEVSVQKRNKFKNKIAKMKVSLEEDGNKADEASDEATFVTVVGKPPSPSIIEVDDDEKNYVGTKKETQTVSKKNDKLKNMLKTMGSLMEETADEGK